jgi:hypothetical protein
VRPQDSGAEIIHERLKLGRGHPALVAAVPCKGGALGPVDFLWARRLFGHESGDSLAAAGNDDFFAGGDPAEELGVFVAKLADRRGLHVLQGCSTLSIQST